MKTMYRVAQISVPIIATVMIVLLVAWLDSYNVRLRRERASQVAQLARKLDHVDVPGVVALLGEPTSIAITRGITRRGDTIAEGCRMRLRYKYETGFLPWRKEEVWLTVGVVVGEARVDGISTDQAFR